MYHCNPCELLRLSQRRLWGWHPTSIHNSTTVPSTCKPWLQASCHCCYQHAVDKGFYLVLSIPARCTVCGQGEACTAAAHRTCRADQLGALHVHLTQHAAGQARDWPRQHAVGPATGQAPPPPAWLGVGNKPAAMLSCISGYSATTASYPVLGMKVPTDCSA